MNFLQGLFKGDKTVWIIFATLCAISLIEVYSAIGTLAYSNKTSIFAPFIRHTVILFVGVAIVVACQRFSYKWTGALVYLFLFVSFLMLILTLSSFGVSANDAKRWIQLFGVPIQPSEISKLSIVLYTAWKFGKAKTKEEKEKAFWWVLGITGATAALIVTENLSTAVLLCLFVYFMMIIAGAPRKHLLILTGIVVVVAVTALLLLYNIKGENFVRWETWHNRLVEKSLDVKDPAYRLTDDNRQVHFAKIAISEGKYLGVFPGNSSQRDFLPQAYSDFIYAIIIEDMGWLGMFLIPLLYIFLLFRVYRISKNCVKSVPMLLAMGAALIVSMQAFINMAVAVGFFPVTGQPLPLVSRGGTSAWITSLYFALILNVSRYGAVENESVILNADTAEDKAAEEAIRAAKEAQDALRKEMSPETYVES